MKKEGPYPAYADDWPRRLPLRAVDWLLIAVTLLVMVLPLLHLALVYASLPAEVPTAFSATGAVIEQDSKAFLLILAGGDVLCTLSVLVCNFFPRAINIPLFLLKRSPEAIIRGTRIYLNVTGLLCAGLFAYMLEAALLAGLGHRTEISGWGVAGFAVALFVAMGVYFFWLWRGDAADEKDRTRFAARTGAQGWPERLPLSTLDKVLIGFSGALLLISLVRLGMLYGSLPATIPTHFDFSGEVNDYGGKSTLLVLGGVDILCWALVIAGNFFPQSVNLPVFMCKRPPEEIAQGTRVLLNIVAVLCVSVFWYIIEIASAVALGTATAMNPLVLWLFMGGLFGPIILYYIWLMRG